MTIIGWKPIGSLKQGVWGRTITYRQKELTFLLDICTNLCYHGIMYSGRRNFLKTLGGFFASFTVAGQLRAQDAKLANNYVRKYQQNSIPPKPITPINPPLKTVGVSGHYATGMFPGNIYCVSGRWTVSG